MVKRAASIQSYTVKFLTFFNFSSLTIQGAGLRKALSLVLLKQ